MGFINNINVDVRGASHIAPCTYKTVILKKNITKENLNILTQAMLDEYGINTKFVIKWDYVLKTNIIIPNNCILEFDGGSVSGEHTVTGQNTSINAGLVKVFNTDITLAGTWNVIEVYPEWFGAKGDGINNDTAATQAASYFAKTTKYRACLKLTAYYLIDSLDIDYVSIEGTSQNSYYVGASDPTFEQLKERLGGSIIIRNSNTKQCIYSANSCRINNLAIYGNHKTGDAIHINMIEDNVPVYGVFVSNNGGTGLYINHGGCDHCNIYNCDGYGIYINEFWDSRIKNCNVSTCNDNYYIRTVGCSEIVDTKSEWSKKNNFVINYANKLQFCNVRIDSANWYSIFFEDTALNVGFSNCLIFGGRRDLNYSDQAHRDYVPDYNKDSSGKKYMIVISKKSQLYFNACFIDGKNGNKDTFVTNFIDRYNEESTNSSELVLTSCNVVNISGIIDKWINTYQVCACVGNVPNTIGVSYKPISDFESWGYNRRNTLYRHTNGGFYVREDDANNPELVGFSTSNTKIVSSISDFKTSGRLIINKPLVLSKDWLTLYPNTILDFTSGGSLKLVKTTDETQKGILEMPISTIIYGKPNIDADIKWNSNKNYGSTTDMNTINHPISGLGETFYNKTIKELCVNIGTSYVTYDGESAGISRIGTTRPTNVKAGFMFFDTSLGEYGKPIWYIGDGYWVDVTGAKV